MVFGKPQSMQEVFMMKESVRQMVYTADSQAFKRALPLVVASAITAYSLKHGPQPLVPQIAASFSLGPAEGSLVVAAEMLGASVMLLVVMFCSAFMNRKKVTGYSLLAAGLLAVIASLVPSFPLLVVIRFIQGILIGTFPALLTAYINEEFEERLTGRLIGLYLGSTAAGGLLGRFLSTLMSGFLSWRITLASLGAAGMVTAVFYLWFLPAPHHQESPHINSFRMLLPLFGDRRLLLLDVIGFALMGSFAAIYTYMTFVLSDAPYFFSKTQLAPIFLFQICGAISSALAGRWTDTHGNGLIMRYALVVLLAGAAITLLPPAAAKCIGLGIFIAGMFAAHTAATGWIGRLPHIPKAPATSLYMLSYYMGGSALSILGGILYHAFGWVGVTAMILTAGALAMICCFLLTERNRVPAADENRIHQSI